MTRITALHMIGVALMVMSVGCGQQAEPAESSSARASTTLGSATSVAPTPTAGIQFDPHWMGVTPAQGWEEQARTINAQFQQFDFRPVDETNLPRGCNGCAPWTAVLTAYAPGKFDPAQAQTAQPVSVIGDNDGFYRPANETDNATLSWQYAPDGWATVEGKTTMTSELDKMRELATALRPDERTPVRLPLALPELPANMPLTEIDIDDIGYGTRLKFGSDGVRLNVQIWPKDGYFGIISEDRAVPVKVGGKDGLYNEESHEAAAKVAPDTVVKFALETAGENAPALDLEEILADVTWAPDVEDDTTWVPVSEWTK